MSSVVRSISRLEFLPLITSRIMKIDKNIDVTSTGAASHGGAV